MNHSGINVRKHEILTCPANPNLITSLSINQNPARLENESRRVCKYGMFQDYRLQLGDRKVYTIDKEENTISINRTWLQLPSLNIPIQSDSYCVRKLLFSSESKIT